MNDIAQLQRAVTELTGQGQHFEVVEGRVHGVHHKLYKNAPATMRDYLRFAVQHSDKPFLVAETERYSFAQAYQMSARFASACSTSCITLPKVVSRPTLVTLIRIAPYWAMVAA